TPEPTAMQGEQGAPGDVDTPGGLDEPVAGNTPDVEDGTSEADPSDVPGVDTTTEPERAEPSGASSDGPPDTGESDSASAGPAAENPPADPSLPVPEALRGASASALVHRGDEARQAGELDRAAQY